MSETTAPVKGSKIVRLIRNILQATGAVIMIGAIYLSFQYNQGSDDVDPNLLLGLIYAAVVILGITIVLSVIIAVRDIKQKRERDEAARIKEEHEGSEIRAYSDDEEEIEDASHEHDGVPGVLIAGRPGVGRTQQTTASRDTTEPERP